MLERLDRAHRSRRYSAQHGHPPQAWEEASPIAEPVASRISKHALTFSRRTALQGLGAGLLVAGLGPGRMATTAEVGTPAAVTPFLGETYVGPTTDPNTLVAVVVAEDGAGTERQAWAYLCDTTTIDVWLTGTLSGDRFDRHAEDGARLEGTLGAQQVAGTATLADGTRLTVTV